MHRYIKKGLSFLVLIFSLCLASIALASGYAKPYFDGFCAGLGGGVVSSTADVKTHYTVDTYGMPTDPAFDLTKDMDLGKHGVNGNIFVGFGKTLDTHYYLGGELFGHLFSPKMKASFEDVVSNTAVSTEVKNPYSFGGDIRGGYLVFPRVMLYLLFGLDYAKFKVNTDALYNGINAMDNNFNKWKLGIIPGLGVEVGLADHLSLRAQYEYAFYSSFSQSETKLFHYDTVMVNDTLDTKVKPSRGLFTLKLSYLFN